MSSSLTWLGHSTVVLDLDGVRIVADPLLRRHAGPLRRRGPVPDPAAWQHADAVLLSHLHHDHAELASLRMLPEGVPVITAEANARWLRAKGLAGVAPPADGWIELGTSGAVSVALCPAVHGSRPMPHRPNPAVGHLVRGRSVTLWLAGDTSLYDGLSELPARAGGTVDVAVVGVSGWAPRLGGGHTGPAQAAEACARVGARWGIPVHWGTFHVPGQSRHPRGWMDRPGPEFAEAVRATVPGCRPVVLGLGERVELPAPGGD